MNWPFFKFLFLAFLSVDLSSAKVNLRHSFFNKQFISQLDDGTYEVVHPFQIRDKKERIGIDTRNYFLNASMHYKQVVIVIKSNSLVGSSRLKLILSLNDYLFFDKTHFKKLDYDGEADLGVPVENCYYQGTVNGDPSTFVAISTCNGLWGLISFNGTNLGIWPLDGGDRGRRHPHVLYQTKWNRDSICGTLTHPSQHQIHQNSRDGRDIVRHRHNRFMKIAVVGDYEYMKEFNLTEYEGMAYILNTINIADLILHAGLGVHLSVVYAELWLDSQRVDLSTDLQQTLGGTLDYATGHLYHVEKDASLFFTGGLFANGEALTSTFSTVCTERAVGVLKAADPYTTHTSAVYSAHVLAHVLGVDHDSSECRCEANNDDHSSINQNHQQQCIMGKQTSFMDAPFGTQFSKCSTARMRSIFAQSAESVKCLLTRPFQAQPLYQCGNGILDAGEECDCGDKNECSDPCCDALTCTLKAHAKCASQQQCCYGCEIRPAGHVCRPSRSSCDVAETCDGRTGDCPADSHLVDGVFCGLNGHCWRGNCMDSEQQCRELWGEDSKPADDLCYTYNQKAVEYGNCGKDTASGQFLQCSNENLRCGTLHCSGGSVTPLSPNLTSFNLQFSHESRQLQCKVVTGFPEGMVKDGTSCAQGNICINGDCLPLAQVSPPIHCPSNNVALQCSGHGDCTTAQTCICFDGWTGLACDVRSNASRRLHHPTRTFTALTKSRSSNFSIPSYFNVNGKSLETTTLLGILFLVGIFLLLMLICLLLFYRRKSSAELYRATPKVADEDSTEDLNRAIKFGSMPSYREEKRKRRRNKLIYDALHRINEGNEERDCSLSPKPTRETSSMLNGSAHLSDTGTPLNSARTLTSPISRSGEIICGNKQQLSTAGSHSSFAAMLNLNPAAETPYGSLGPKLYTGTGMGERDSKYGSLKKQRLNLVAREIADANSYCSFQPSMQHQPQQVLNSFVVPDQYVEHHHPQHQQISTGYSNRGFTPPLFPPQHQTDSGGGGGISPTRSDFYDGRTVLNAVGLTNFGGGGRTRGNNNGCGYATDTELTLLRCAASKNGAGLGAGGSLRRRYNPSPQHQPTFTTAEVIGGGSTLQRRIPADEDGRGGFRESDFQQQQLQKPDQNFGVEGVLAPSTLRLHNIQMLMKRLNGEQMMAAGGESLVDPNSQHQESSLNHFTNGGFDSNLLYNGGYDATATTPSSYDFYPMGPTLSHQMMGIIPHSHSDTQHPPSAPSADSGHPGSTLDMSARDSRDSPSLATMIPPQLPNTVEHQQPSTQHHHHHSSSSSFKPFDLTNS